MTLLPDGKIKISWDTLGKDVFYDYEISQMGNAYKFLALQLPEQPPKQR